MSFNILIFSDSLYLSFIEAIKKLEHLIQISFFSVLIRVSWDFISATFVSNWYPRYGLGFKKSSTLVIKISMAEQSSHQLMQLIKLTYLIALLYQHFLPRTAYSVVEPQLERDLETKNKANFSHQNTFRTEVQKYNIYHCD